MSGGNFRWTAASFWLGTLVLIAASAHMFITHAMNDITAVAVLFGVMVMITSYFTYIGMDKEGRDERARKIGTMAATFSWYGSLTFVGFVAVFSFWGGRQFTAAEVFGIAIFLMTAIMAVVTAYYHYRGDVE